MATDYFSGPGREKILSSNPLVELKKAKANYNDISAINIHMHTAKILFLFQKQGKQI